MGEGPGSRPGAVTRSLGVCWQLSLDKELIDFGSYVVGETTSRVITLTNTGGLGTEFRIQAASQSCETDFTQLVTRMVSVRGRLIEGPGEMDSVAEQPVFRA